MAKKWHLEGTIKFYAHDIESDGKDNIEVLDDLMEMGLFDNAVCTISFDEEHCGCDDNEAQYQKYGE